MTDLSQAVLIKMPAGIDDGIKKLWDAVGVEGSEHFDVFTLAVRAINQGNVWRMVATHGMLKAVTVSETPEGEYSVDEVGEDYIFPDVMRVESMAEVKAIYAPILGNIRVACPCTLETATMERDSGTCNFIIMPTILVG